MLLCKARMYSMLMLGVWGHALQEVFEKYVDALRLNLRAFQSQNISQITVKITTEREHVIISMYIVNIYYA